MAESLDESIELKNFGKCRASDFALEKTLGKGGYAMVYLVQKISEGANHGKYFAMKIVKKASIVTSLTKSAGIKAEKDILKAVEHPFIVQLHYAFQTKGYLFLVLDFVQGGELFNLMEVEHILDEDQTRFYSSEVILAIEHLHSLGIIYRDLKPENVLIDAEGHVKLTDFGLSKQHLNVNGRTRTFCGTVEYMAPEILALKANPDDCIEKSYDKQVDWFSLGALLMDMLTGNPPWRVEERPQSQETSLEMKTTKLKLIKEQKLYFPKRLSKESKDLVTQLLKDNPLERLGAQTREHPFYKSVNWNDVYHRNVTPPMIPTINGPNDVSNFDEMFTRIPPTPADFEFGFGGDFMFFGFTYTHPAILEMERMNHQQKENATVEIVKAGAAPRNDAQVFAQRTLVPSNELQVEPIRDPKNHRNSLKFENFDWP